MRKLWGALACVAVLAVLAWAAGTTSQLDTLYVRKILFTGTDSSPARIRSCEIHLWGTGAAGIILATDDEVFSCLNTTGADLKVTGVTCWANGGTTTSVTPILTAGSGTSIVSTAVTCGNGAFSTTGSINGTPIIHSATAAGSCASAPCSVDANVTAVDAGTTNIRIVITESF